MKHFTICKRPCIVVNAAGFTIVLYTVLTARFSEVCHTGLAQCICTSEDPGSDVNKPNNTTCPEWMS